MENIEQSFKSETRTIMFLMRAFFFLIHVGIVAEFVTNPKFHHVIRFIFFLWLAKPYYKTIKHRFYTYWTFSFLLIFYLTYKIYEYLMVSGHEYISALYIVSLTCLMVKMYLLFSPIYYPRVSWWEYDFRYKDDLKIMVKSQDKEYKARLTDLRRHAGCVAMFEELKLGEEIVVNATFDDAGVLLRGIVMSKRREIIGRPLIYGVQFKFDSKSNKKRYNSLVKMWTKQKDNKMKMKFSHV